jgi:hypothetical protein
MGNLCFDGLTDGVSGGIEISVAKFLKQCDALWCNFQKVALEDSN